MMLVSCFSFKTMFVCCMGLLMTLQVDAATQGVTGTVSVGQFAVEVNVEKLVQVSMSHSIHITHLHQSSQHTTPVCVYSNAKNATDRQYFVMLDSEHGHGEFLLNNVSDNVTASYVVTWSDGSHTATLSDNIEASTPFSGSSTLDCESGTQALLTLAVPAIENVSEGSYADTLHIQVRPN